MQNRFKNVYLAHRAVRLVTWAALLGLCALVIWGAEGVPPVSWRVLFQVAPLLPHLWHTQRTALLLPLSLLVIQALTWPILACLLLRVWLTLLYYSWSAKQGYQLSAPAFSTSQQQQAAPLVSPPSHGDGDLYNATTDAFPLLQFSPVTISGRHSAIRIPTQPGNGAEHGMVPPFQSAPVPIRPSFVSVPHLSGGIPPSPTPVKRASPSRFWTFDSISRP